MILLYALIVLVLGAGALVAGRRARSLERKFVRAAQKANEAAKELSYRGGNGNLPDPLKSAKRQLEIGRLVEVRDRLEEKYAAWESRAESLRTRQRALRSCQGRFVPYAIGVVDFLGVFAVLALTKVVDPDHLRIAIQSARMLVAK
jgi:hypothetical protein